MKKITLISIVLFAGIGITILINGCATSQTVTAKNGSQLWSENCVRCHNTPPSSDYSGAQWETIGMHMKLRANLTDEETNKVVSFLTSGQ